MYLDDGDNWGMKKEGDFRGTITVFLALSLLMVFSLITTIIESARQRSMKMRAELAMDMGLQSIFAEYDINLLKQFDLYFIDSTYRGCDSGAESTKQHLKEYMNINLKPQTSELVLRGIRLFDQEVETVNLTFVSLATDRGMSVYKRQAIQAIKDRYGIGIIEDLVSNKTEYDERQIENCDMEAIREENRQALQSCDDVVDEEGNPVEFEDPTESIEEHRNEMLDLVLDGIEYSARTVNTGILASGRNLNQGDGLVAADGPNDSFTDNLLFDAYLLDKFSYYGENKGRNGLDYELEYIIEGDECDAENLESIVKKILMIREAANYMYLQTDNEKKNVAKGVAEVLSILLFSPELAEIIEQAILIAWAFAESCVDVRTLLDGGKVPIYKSSSTWVLSWLDALRFRSHITDGRSVQNGISYKEYLGLFIVAENMENKLKRSIDMIENDIRKMDGNSGFCMDKCIEFIEADVRIISAFGYNTEIKRYFGYMEMPEMTY